MLSPQLLRILQLLAARPSQRWLFPGRDDERRSYPTFARWPAVQLAAAGLEQAGDGAYLRHTFATHLLESGRTCASSRFLLGHAASRDARYTESPPKTISNTPSPLDRLRLEVVPPG